MALKSMIPHPALWASVMVLVCGACDGLPYTWRTVTVEDETFQIRRNPITGISDVWWDLPGNFESRQVRMKMQFQCEGAGVLTRIRDIEVLSGPPLPELEELTDDPRTVGWAFLRESESGPSVEAMRSVLGCRD